MISLLKLLIIIVALAAFIYCASLAMQGDLEPEIIMRDYITAKSHLLNFAHSIIQKYR